MKKCRGKFKPIKTDTLTTFMWTYRVQGTGYRVQGTGYRVQDTWYRVQGTHMDNGTMEFHVL